MPVTTNHNLMAATKAQFHVLRYIHKLTEIEAMPLDSLQDLFEVSKGVSDEQALELTRFSRMPKDDVVSVCSLAVGTAYNQGFDSALENGLDVLSKYLSQTKINVADDDYVNCCIALHELLVFQHNAMAGRDIDAGQVSLRLYFVNYIGSLL